jgi:homoserine dehydrogenase
VALLGFGTVGSSVAKNSLRALEHPPAPDPRPQSQRGAKKSRLASPSVQWTENIDDVLSSDVDIVVEVMGGLQPTEDWIRRALQSGKSVVTANKQLIARCGPELIALATRRISRFSLARRWPAACP